MAKPGWSRSRAPTPGRAARTGTPSRSSSAAGPRPLARGSRGVLMAPQATARCARWSTGSVSVCSRAPVTRVPEKSRAWAVVSGRTGLGAPGRRGQPRLGRADAPTVDLVHGGGPPAGMIGSLLSAQARWPSRGRLPRGALPGVPSSSGWRRSGSGPAACQGVRGRTRGARAGRQRSRQSESPRSAHSSRSRGSGRMMQVSMALLPPATAARERGAGRRCRAGAGSPSRGSPWRSADRWRGRTAAPRARSRGRRPPGPPGGRGRPTAGWRAPRPRCRREDEGVACMVNWIVQSRRGACGPGQPDTVCRSRSPQPA